jgi:hypothetical protein
MPIIALVLSTLAFWIFYWFVRMGGMDHIRASSQKRKEEARRAAARERERTTMPARRGRSARGRNHIDAADGESRG